MRVPAAMLLIGSSAFGQNLNGLAWRGIGPAATGGRITDLDVVRTPGRPSEIYVATASGGIFKSVNEGVSWSPMFDHAGGMMSIGAVAVAPSQHAIEWAGTGEADNRQSSSQVRDEMIWALQNNYTFQLWVRDGADLSPELLQARNAGLLIINTFKWP